jgi:pyruvyl transferase EpsO
MAPPPVPATVVAPAEPAERVRWLRARATTVLRDVLADVPRGPCALLDFPYYRNVGDEAIWLGSLAALAALGFPPPAYTCGNDTYDARRLARRVGGGAIFLVGGGNFGDLHPKHQRLREGVLADFPGNPVVQLPQTIDFRSPDARGRCGRAIAAHGRFRLLVRDERSVDVARAELGVTASLCPDLALFLDAPPRSRPREGGILWLARADAHRRHEPPREPDVRVSDWPDARVSVRRWALKMCSRIVRRPLVHVLPLRGALSATFGPAAREHVGLAFDWISSADVVVTDRLHGHLFALLTGTPQVLLDDATGKVRRFHDAWTRGTTGVHPCDDVAHALAEARRLARPASGT